jgi:hypothetical protein
VKIPISRLTPILSSITLPTMSTPDFDQLRIDYKNAVDKWVDTIRAEEALATPDHSITAMERWDDAHFRQHDAHAKADKAREAYKDALRSANYGI